MELNFKETKVYTFFPPYDKKIFYSYLGPFFAERHWRNQLPYLINSSTKLWWVLINQRSVIGFGSLENSDRGFEIGDIYGYTDECWKYVVNILYYQCKKRNRYSNIFSDVSKVEPQQLEFFQNKGFEICRESKNYYFLTKIGYRL